MRVFFLLISLLFTLLPLQAEEPDTCAHEAVQRFNFSMTSDKGELSGILVLAHTDKNIEGAIINEFGFTGIVFSYNKKSGKVKLRNTISFLNKWRIKYVLKQDLTVAIKIIEGITFNIPKHYDFTSSDDEIKISNRRYGLNYTFSPLPQCNATEQDL